MRRCFSLRLVPWLCAFLALTAPALATASEGALFSGLSNAVIYVSDQAAARKFYTEALKLPVVHDDPFEPQSRWLTVRAGSSPTVLLLYQPPAADPRRGRIGGWTGITFMTDSMETTVAGLKAAGVAHTPPWKADWGALETEISDPDGNSFYVIQILPKP